MVSGQANRAEREVRSGECDRVFFLVGAERSGSTMLRLMLDSHPRLSCYAEFEFAVERMDGDDWPDLGSYVEWLVAQRLLEDGGFEILETASTYPEVVRGFLAQRRGPGIELVGATLHRDFNKVLRLWPDARFIHLVRDPRDVASSCILMGWAGNHWTAVERWVECEQMWDDLAARAGADRIVTVRYEDLVREPEAQLTRICAALGIEFDQRMFGYADQTAYAVPDASVAEKWRRRLSENDVRLVEVRAGSIMKSRGYGIARPDAKAPGTMERLCLRIHDRWYRERFQIRRIGFRLWLARFIVQRTGPRRLLAAVLSRIYDINRRHWK